MQPLGGVTTHRVRTTVVDGTPGLCFILQAQPMSGTQQMMACFTAVKKVPCGLLVRALLSPGNASGT